MLPDRYQLSTAFAVYGCDFAGFILLNFQHKQLHSCYPLLH